MGVERLKEMNFTFYQVYISIINFSIVIYCVLWRV